MSTFHVRLILPALACIAAGQQPPAAIPPWLSPYPGSKPETRAALSSRVENTYTTRAKPDEVEDHYRKLFEAERLPFQPNPDGIGIAIRAAVKCDLLITIWERQEGSQVRVSCATNPPAPPPSPKASAAAGSAVPAANPGPYSREMAERIRQGEEHTRRTLADAESAHKNRMHDMSVYDKPVYPKSKKSGTPRPANRK